ncbi:hypothetical protein FRB94_013877 [Tulasnella sp. JGI-2019a]|nr:hypothetical protein FRB94_013877 [Tulasnella sp. JGI-2019a]KAG9004538.1 hypothetical protein FRB93_010315 [Tulasnella sp. JGI-2019a]KAG9022236.1 hypothetical protein FRB95_000518 [Tulasnella sp. JGI-2019a]
MAVLGSLDLLGDIMLYHWSPSSAPMLSLPPFDFTSTFTDHPASFTEGSLPPITSLALHQQHPYVVESFPPLGCSDRHHHY